MLTISNSITLADWEIHINAIRAQGAGGQNVNKVSSAVHLRFDIAHSTLPAIYKERLLSMNDQRISKDGVIIIKAQQFRTLEKNKEDALNRLKDIIQQAMVKRKTRMKTKPSYNAKQKRMDSKKQRGRIKALRGKID